MTDYVIDRRGLVVYIPKSWTTFRRILICAIFRPRDMQKCYMLFWILRKGYDFIINLKTYLSSALKHLFGCHFKHAWKKRNIIVTFQSSQLTEQTKTLDDLGCFDFDDKYVLRLLNVVIHEHQFKRKGIYCKYHFDKEAYTKPKTSGSLRSKLKVFIWRHVVYIPKSWTTIYDRLRHR
jgi:ADP-heptose:LPS heptosyltransferase